MKTLLLSEAIKISARYIEKMFKERKDILFQQARKCEREGVEKEEERIMSVKEETQEC